MLFCNGEKRYSASMVLSIVYNLNLKKMMEEAPYDLIRLLLEPCVHKGVQFYRGKGRATGCFVIVPYKMPVILMINYISQCNITPKRTHNKDLIYLAGLFIGLLRDKKELNCFILGSLYEPTDKVLVSN